MVLKQKMMKVVLCGTITTSIGTGLNIADNNKVYAQHISESYSEQAEKYPEVMPGAPGALGTEAGPFETIIGGISSALGLKGSHQMPPG